MKTKSEIFNTHKTMVGGKEVLTYGNAIKAMDEYVDQQTEQLKKQLEEKEKEVKDLKTRVAKRDIQKIFCEVLEDNHHRNVYYENKKLKSQLSEKDKELSELKAKHKDMLLELIDFISVDLLDNVPKEEIIDRFLNWKNEQ